MFEEGGQTLKNNLVKKKQQVHKENRLHRKAKEVGKQVVPHRNENNYNFN